MLSLLPFLLIIVVLWFFMIRPQTKRQREAAQMQATLVVGTKVMLTSGIFGVVAEVTDDYVLVEVSETTSIKVIRAAIGRILPETFGEPEPAEGEAAADGTVTAADVDPSVEPIEPAPRVEPTESGENR